MARSQLEDFEIVSKLGAGSFGTVFKVRRYADDLTYVIKSVRIAELPFREQNEAINEVKILAQLDNAYVVQYFDSFLQNDCLYIVMEYCNRGDLQSLLKKAKEKNVISLKEDILWNIFLQILLGLYYLHGKNILHRDLKTANVFLSKNPNASTINSSGGSSSNNYLVKIGDLGVAKLMDTSTALASTIVGTPYYLSPELCKDLPYRDKSDCWALGVLLYECCTLQRPFEARNQCALIMKIIESPCNPIPTHVSPVLKNLVTWLLQKEPNVRPSIKEILCEEFVIDQLQEHNFSLPNDLLSAPTTNYLIDGIDYYIHPEKYQQQRRGSASSQKRTTTSGSNRSTSSSSSTRPSSGHSMQSSGSASQLPRASAGSSSGSGSGNIGVPPPRQNPTASGIRRTTGTVSSAAVSGSANNVDSYTAANNVVRGNRVRGGHSVAHQPSSKAMMRYQIPPPVVATPASIGSNSYNTPVPVSSPQKMMVLSSGADRKVTLDDEDEEKTFKPGHKSAKEEEEDDEYELEMPRDDAKDSYYASIPPRSNLLSELKADEDKYSAIRDNKEEISGIYEEDFEQFDDDGPLDVIEEEGPMDDVTQRYSYETPAVSGTNGTQEEESVDALYRRISDSRRKCIQCLGDGIFWKVYEVCHRHMYADYVVSDDDIEEQDSSNIFQQELEEILYENNVRLDIAWEAILGVKVLLALESKYDRLVDERPYGRK